MRAVPDAAITLIKQFEGCKLICYADGAGFKTIGIGHKVLPQDKLEIGDEITQEQADELFEKDLERIAAGVEGLLPAGINDNMFAALISFSFNLGVGNLQHSSLLRKLKTGDIDGAAEEFQKWVYAGHEISNGLIRRRDAEKSLFLSQVAS